jgi:hypothetical protein
MGRVVAFLVQLAMPDGIVLGPSASFVPMISARMRSRQLTVDVPATLFGRAGYLTIAAAWSVA